MRDALNISVSETLGWTEKQRETASGWMDDTKTIRIDGQKITPLMVKYVLSLVCNFSYFNVSLTKKGKSVR